MELFFDYACPYCYEGHKNLLGLIDGFPGLNITWRPCEAHPRPERASVHSDLAIQGMYFLEEHQGDLWKYHLLIYSGRFDEGKDISDINFLSECAGACGADIKEFKKALTENRYGDKVIKGNIYAWGDHQLQAVPSYLSDDAFIGSHNGILVTKDELRNFLASIS